jgi:hypothetical protein
MIYDFKLLGGVVDPAQAWLNDYGDTGWHEVGDGNWRVSFVPTAPGKVMVQAGLSKHRMGAGSAYSRLYSKARIVLVAPVYKNDYVSYSESMWESTSSVIRFSDCPMVLFLVADITAQAVGLTHTFAVEHMAGDGLHGEVCYGAPFVILG